MLEQGPLSGKVLGESIYSMICLVRVALARFIAPSIFCLITLKQLKYS